jgi:hypothetical protein
MELSQNGRNPPAEGYRPHRGLMLATLLCIGSRLPWSLFMWSWSTWLYWSRSSSMLNWRLLQVAVWSNAFIYLAGIIAFLCWLHGAYRNLRPLGSTKPEISKRLPAMPSRAVVSFLIPIVQFVRARRVMVHLWRESQPAPAVLPDGTLLLGKTRLVNWWYATWLLSYITGGYVGHGAYRPVWPSLSGLLTWTSAILCCVMVWTIEKRQAEQFHDLQLRQPAPPVTDQLR